MPDSAVIDITITVDKKKFEPSSLTSVPRGTRVTFSRGQGREDVTISVSNLNLFGVEKISLGPNITSARHTVRADCPPGEYTISCMKQSDKGGGGIETMSGSIRVSSG